MKLKSKTTNSIKKIVTLIIVSTALMGCETAKQAGKDFNLLPAGYYALGSLRLEKAYRSWGHDISSNDDLLSSGLVFGIDWDKKNGFIGLEKLLESFRHVVKPTSNKPPRIK